MLEQTTNPTVVKAIPTLFPNNLMSYYGGLSTGPAGLTEASSRVVCCTLPVCDYSAISDPFPKITTTKAEMYLCWKLGGEYINTIFPAAMLGQP
jgi:hypothetical protein